MRRSRRLPPFSPTSAARFWAGHPVGRDLARRLPQIGASRARAEPIDAATFAMIDDAAAKSPLAPEPFLVRGVQAQTAGDQATARSAPSLPRNGAIRARCPRPISSPNDYFRAGSRSRAFSRRHCSRVCRPAELRPSRLSLRAYAQNRANWPQMRALFRSQSRSSRTASLLALAHDPREHRRDPGACRWQPSNARQRLASGAPAQPG